MGEAVDVDDRDRSVVEARCRAAGAALVALGAGAAMVSAGRHGVACVTAARDEFVPAPAVDVVNPIGAGDALLGATLVALERGRPFELAVREGVAYAAASVADPVAGYADPSGGGRPRAGARAMTPSPPRRAPTVTDVAVRAGSPPRRCRAPSTTRPTCDPTRSPASASPPRSSASARTTSPACCAPAARRR